MGHLVLHTAANAPTFPFWTVLSHCSFSSVLHFSFLSSSSASDLLPASTEKTTRAIPCPSVPTPTSLCTGSQPLSPSLPGTASFFLHLVYFLLDFKMYVHFIYSKNTSLRVLLGESLHMFVSVLLPPRAGQEHLQHS